MDLWKNTSAMLINEQAALHSAACLVFHFGKWNMEDLNYYLDNSFTVAEHVNAGSK